MRIWSWKKENEVLKIENLEKNLIISKVKSEKFILFNELNELTNSLKAVDLKVLNKFYKSYTSNLKLNKSFMPCSLGIKYNILSVQTQLSYLMHSDLVSSKNFSEYVTKNKDSTPQKEQLKENINMIPKEKPVKSTGLNFNEEPQINLNEPENMPIDLGKYLTVVKKFEKEFDKVCEKSLRKPVWRYDE